MDLMSRGLPQDLALKPPPLYIPNGFQEQSHQGMSTMDKKHTNREQVAKVSVGLKLYVNYQMALTCRFKSLALSAYMRDSDVNRLDI